MAYIRVVKCDSCGVLFDKEIARKNVNHNPLSENEGQRKCVHCQMIERYGRVVDKVVLEDTCRIEPIWEPHATTT